MLSVIMLNVTYKPFMLNVIILSVFMLSVVALFFRTNPFVDSGKALCRQSLQKNNHIREY